MLSIRMQRIGRKGLAQFRVIVQDSRLSPKSGKFVANLGHYNPHTKEHGVDLEKAKFYLDHGAQPSQRVARLLSVNGVKLPDWVNLRDDLEGKLKNAEKLRKNQPDEPAAEETPAEQATETPSEEAPAEAATDTDSKEEAPVEEKAEEKPAEEPKAEDKSEEAPAESDDSKETK
ncbi:MAG: 30S ribosomal protein S16 [Patescibacteria group bacterium]